MVLFRGSLNLPLGFLPAISFLVCVLISTSCGTSSGSVTAVAPMMLPLAAELGCDVGLTAGAIISGAIFGDNLAPISDTTIGSALTQDAKIGDIVRTRLPYSLIAGGLALCLFIAFGMRTGSSSVISYDADASSVKALAMLVLPLLMIYLMRRGQDLVSTLLICDLTGIVLALVLGCIPVSTMLDNAGPIGAGLSGMMGMLLYILLLFQILEILNVSGAFEHLMNAMLKRCKTPRSGELAGMIMTAVTAAAAGGSSPAIIFCGPMVRSVAERFHTTRTRGANILDGTACGISGLLPYGTCCMLCLQFSQDCTPEGFSFLNILPYSFHSMFLLLLFALSVLTGVGRKFED